MATFSITTKKLGHSGKGYRVLASWRLPKSSLKKRKVDLWIPELAPRLTLVSELRKGVITWEMFRRLYAIQLRTPAKQDLLKPLALLSLRKNLVLLCNCPEGWLCPNTVLAEALEECRKSKNFALTVRIAA